MAISIKKGRGINKQHTQMDLTNVFSSNDSFGSILCMSVIINKEKKE